MYSEEESKECMLLASFDDNEIQVSKLTEVSTFQLKKTKQNKKRKKIIK